MVNWFNEKDKLYKLIVIENVPYEQIGKIYGCCGNNIKKVARRLGIELKQKRKINSSETFNKSKREKSICLNCLREFEPYPGSNGKFCCVKCSGEYRHKENYKKIISGDPEIMVATFNPRNFKEDIISEQNGKCSICGCEQVHNGKPLVFILDHIDGHAANNKRDNLRCICPNCDSQLDTYKSKNIKVVGVGDRYFLRYKQTKQDL